MRIEAYDLMVNKRSVVPLNTASEAFELFNRFLVPFVIDARGEKVYFDRRLDFRTAMVPEPSYLRNIKKGELLWRQE